MVGKNIKKKHLMCQIPIKMLKQHAIPASILRNLKIYSSKGCRILVKDELYKTMYLANTVVLDIRVFSRRYYFRLWVFASAREYFYY